MQDRCAFLTAVRTRDLPSGLRVGNSKPNAGYGSVRTFAQLLGRDKVADLLQQTLDDESEANELLNKLAEDTLGRLGMLMNSSCGLLVVAFVACFRRFAGFFEKIRVIGSSTLVPPLRWHQSTCFSAFSAF